MAENFLLNGFEKFSKDRARWILFITSLSVILITLGIIQTLLFEAISFFKQVASARGWFTLDLEFAGLTSQTGLSAVIFLLAFTAEYVSNHKPEKLSSIPEKALFPPKLVKNILFIIRS